VHAAELVATRAVILADERVQSAEQPKRGVDGDAVLHHDGEAHRRLLLLGADVTYEDGIRDLIDQSE